MPQYRFCTLYSGSGGNAAYLETEGARILIDAGKCTRTLLASLKSIGVGIETVDAIVVTHDHNDHTAALEVLTKKYRIPVIMLYECARRYEPKVPEALASCMTLYREAPFAFRLGDVTVRAFKTPHDSRASVGYRFDIHGAEGDTSVGYATDIGYITEDIRAGLYGCEAVVLESNHDEDMLMAGPYPYDLKLRIKSRRGHLSNHDCANFAAELAAAGTKYFLLAHLSEENNYPDLAYDETASALAGYAAVVSVASPSDVVMLMGDANAPIEKVLINNEKDAGEEVSV